MSNLSRTKNVWKKLYSKYAAYINPLLKFLLALFVFLTINAKIGYMDRLNSFAIVLIVALFCSFMPMSVMGALGAIFILLHMYALSMECALVAAVIIFLMFILFIRFTPKETIVVILMPVLFMLKIPYILPVAMGLIGTPVSIISIAFGVVMSYLVSFTNDNAAALLAMEDETLITRLRFVIDGMVANKSMIILIVLFGIILMVVYTIRRLSIDHSWKYASIAGGLISIVLCLICQLILDMGLSVAGIFIGSILAVGVGILLDFLQLDLDYKGAENLQFEDDDYYYYVKAIPKTDAPDRKKKSAAKKSQNRSYEERDYSRSERSTASGQRTVRTANGVKRSTDYR